MSKVIAVIFLVLCLVVLFFLIRMFTPAFKSLLSRLPKGIFILLFILVLGFIAYLGYYIFCNDPKGGNPGADGEVTEVQENIIESEDIVKENIENCIILRDEEIWIDNQRADMETVNKYIDYRVENNITLTIVDDYSVSSLHHEITELCDKKGVNYTTENETWLEK